MRCLISLILAFKLCSARAAPYTPTVDNEVLVHTHPHLPDLHHLYPH